jgi:hypothetical protein
VAKGVKRAGSRKTVTEANLAALGADHLAAILVEAAEDEPNLKRRLRMELAGAVGPDHLAADIAKGIATIQERRSRIHWRKYKAFVRILELLRSMIVSRLGEADPKLALDFLWRFLALANDVFARVDDARAQVGAVFAAAVADLGSLVARARPDNTTLAEQVVAALGDDDHQVLGDLAAVVVAVLDDAGVAALRAQLQMAFEAKPKPPPVLRAALQLVTDAQGDVDGYVATLSADEIRQPWTGAQIARRLLAAGRVEEALAALTRSAPPASARTLLPGVHDWEEVFLEALEADGQAELAQELRWAAFEKRLATDRLRDFLKRLPDFDDVEAEERALGYADAFPNFTEALRFFTEWPAPANAAELTLNRTDEIMAGAVEVLAAAVPMLEARHPLAATILLRAMVADTLGVARVNRYKDALRQLDELAALSIHIHDWGALEPHDDFLARMARIRRL